MSRIVYRAALPGPRWWAWFRAFFGGYFWLPCGLCGRSFGGHEVYTDPRPQLTSFDEFANPRAIYCPSCERARADERHAAYLVALTAGGGP